MHMGGVCVLLCMRVRVREIEGGQGKSGKVSIKGQILVFIIQEASINFDDDILTGFSTILSSGPAFQCSSLKWHI